MNTVDNGTPKVICDTGSFRLSDASLPDLDYFDMTIEDPRWIQFSVEASLKASTVFNFGRESKMTISHEYMKKLPHDLVCQCRGLETSDEKLSKIKPLMDETDRLTPDGISMTDSGVFEVLEVKTSRSYEGVARLFEAAKAKYYNALGKRVRDFDIVFSILVVCPTGVYTNLSLSQEEIDTLVVHYQLGIFLQEQAKARGWNPDDIFSEEMEFARNFRGIGLDDSKINCRGEPEPLHIDQEMLRSWRALPLKNVDKIFDVNFVHNAPKYNKILSELKKTEVPLRMFAEHLNKFENKIPADTSDKISPIFHLPFIPVKDHSPITKVWRVSELGKHTISLDNPYGKLWSDAINQCILNEDRFGDILGPDAEREIEVNGFWEAPPDSVSKSKRYVVKVHLNEEQRIEFARRGVQAKVLKKDRDIIIDRENSKKTYGLDADTQDIDKSFETLESWLEPGPIINHPSDQKIARLVEKARLIAGDKIEPQSEAHIKSFLSTKCGLALTFLNEVISEVNFTRLKNVSKDCFVFKRLPNYHAYLLLKPTTSEKHIFFSVMVPKEVFQPASNLSEGWINIGSSVCTKFMSLDRHKISHLLYCHVKMALMHAFWNHQFSGTSMDFFKARNKRAETHFWMSMIIYLEDKEKTSTALQLFRYAYMEVVKGGILHPDPGKIFSKVDPLLRSRLLVYCLSCFNHAFSEMLRSPPKVGEADEDEEASEDSVKELLSWVDHEPLQNYEQALNLSYLGVLHNKEEGDLVHGYLKIFDKIIDQELKMRTASVEKMTIDQGTLASNFRDHEFSAVAVKSFAETTKKAISKRGGLDYDSWARGALSVSLLRRTFEELATSKSSADLSPEDPPEDDLEEREFNKIITLWKNKKLDQHPKPALKCIENIYNLLKSLDANDNKVFKHFEVLLNDLETSGGIHVKLFKKLQIGGTREIFILPIKARIVVNFLETVSRTICEQLSCEMLTKGDQKILRSDAHYKKRNTLSTFSNSMTIINSDDAATWAQRFVMPAFGVMLSVLVPDPFLNPCLRVLNLITSKRLVLPTELLRLFSSYKSVSSFNANTNRLKQEYLEPLFEETTGQPRMLVQCKSNLMANRSNMMQGILHYTSSLLHSCFMTCYVAYLEMRLNLKYQGNRVSSIATGKVSSDDSSLLLSIAYDSDMSDKTKTFLLKAGTFFCHLKGDCYPLFCAKQSVEKSTVAGTNLIEEFNSLWYFRNTLLTPSIKFVAACVRTHVTEQFETRLNVMAGLRSQVLENTGSIFLTSVAQYCQMRAHYMSLGSLSNPLFPMYARDLEGAPHPALGFFVLEPSIAAGLLGYKYAFYLLVSKCERASKASSFFMSSSFMAMNENITSCTSLSLTHGSKLRYEAMLRRMDIDRDSLIEHYNSYPEELFEPPCTKEAVMNSVALKAATPSMSNSFEFLTDSKQHAASSYILQSPCITIVFRNVVKDPNDEQALITESTYHKKSLCGLTLNYRKSCSNVFKKSLTMDEMQMLFPCMGLYRQFSAYLEIVREEYIQETSLREKKCYVMFSVPKFGISFLSSPISAIKAKWFGRNVRYSMYEVNQTWTTLSGLFPWLKPSYIETITSSQFGSAVALHQFFRSLPVDNSTVRVLTTASKRASTFTTLKDLVCKAQWPKIILRSPSSSGEDITKIKRKGDMAPTPSIMLSFETTVHEFNALGAGVELPFIKRQLADVIATSLWFEASLPDSASTGLSPQVTHNDSRVRRILTDCLDIVNPKELELTTAYSQLTPRDATLAIFQYVVKHGKNKAVDVSNILKCTKRGLVGKFVKRATYKVKDGKGFYEGHAIFRGTFNDIPFELHSWNEGCTKVVVKKLAHSKKLALGFYRTIEDLHCHTNATQHEVKSSTSNRHPLFYNPRSGEIENKWKSGWCVIEENSKMPESRTIGNNVSFEQSSQNKVIRLVDRKPEARPSRKGQRPDYHKGYTVLHYTPVQPPKLEMDPANALNPFVMKAKAKYGISKNPYDVFVSGVGPDSDSMLRCIKSALSKGKTSLETHYPGVTQWCRDTLRARAETTLGMLPTSASLSSYLHTAEFVDTLDSLKIEDQEEGNLPEVDPGDLYGDDMLGDDFDLEDIEGLLSEIEPDSSIVTHASSSTEMTGAWFSQTEVDPDVDLTTQYQEFRPMAEYNTRRDPGRHSPMWDKFLEEFKKNASSETRSKAFNGKCKKGSADIVQTVARLFCKEGESHFEKSVKQQEPKAGTSFSM